MKGAGEYYTTSYGMRIDSHQEDISWEVAQIEENIAGYLPMFWLYLHVTGPDTQGPRTTDSSLITKSNFRSELRSQSRIQ
jgi:hypothetical protein